MTRSWILPPCLALSLIAAYACGHSHKGPGVTPDASTVCGLFGQACTSGSDCCSGTCDPQGGCTVNTMHCSQAGTSCATGTDCCSFGCVGNVCQNSCVADNGTCASNGECCGGLCRMGKCTPLNTGCKSSGNSCTGNGPSTECCGGYCNAGTCGNGSWCIVDGNTCSHDAECCGGICTIQSGGTVGLCEQPNPGATNCSAGIDGSLCNTCADCCSALCAVYQPTGIKVCQPAEGCRVDGDTCHHSTDCCGGPGTTLPGHDEVICLGDHGEVPNAQDTIGICRNPTGCDPEGDTCHYKNYTCGNSSTRNDCCACISGKDCCKLDALGVPRCNAVATCVDPGGSCAFSGDCCNGLPCVPDSNGQLHCGTTMCQMTGGTCSNDSDCCNGTSCVFQPGQTFGTCGGMTNCAGNGQACNASMPCCTGAMCDVSGTGTPCPAGMNTGCSCEVNQIP